MCTVYRSGSDLLPLIMGMPAFMLPHFTIEYRKHFTQFHSTVVETAGGISIGQTEAFAIYIVLHLLFAVLPTTNGIMDTVIDLNKDFGIPIPFKFTYGAVLGFFTSFSLGG